MNSLPPEIVVVGGSAGSVSVLIQLLEELPQNFPFALVLVIHRQKSVPSEMDKVLGFSSNIEVIEPNDKDFVLANRIYLAPQNYHLLFEQDRTFSLDYSEAIYYSRPAIDPAFESAADVYGPKAVGILLSGANQDGSQGLAHLVQQGGRAIIQEPQSCEFPAMPLAGLQVVPQAEVAKPAELINRLFSL
ncbi:chemotaxis protein CheB [Siphonobacter sp.]|uniref:chemotaxis protein CheB n=1 Tax=Siphonobacter sp. TaxID=1869184 RepID=UPI003B3BDFD4